MKNWKLYSAIAIVSLSGILIILGAMFKFLGKSYSEYVLASGLVLELLGTIWMIYALRSKDKVKQ